jgi:hypothetical protein
MIRHAFGGWRSEIVENDVFCLQCGKRIRVVKITPDRLDAVIPQTPRRFVRPGEGGDASAIPLLAYGNAVSYVTAAYDEDLCHGGSGIGEG